eukprot:s1246_g2.t1
MHATKAAAFGPFALRSVKKRDTKKKLADDPKWKLQAMELRNTLPLDRRRATPWSNKARLQGLPGTDRVKEMIDLAYLCTEASLKAAGLPSSPDQVTATLSVDVSQNAARKAWGSLRTLCTSSSIYLYGQDRAMLPIEGLRLMGFGTRASRAGGLSDGEVVDLVGNCMAVPSVALAQLALLAAGFEHNSLPNLFEHSRPSVLGLRDGKTESLPVSKLVPAEVIHLRSGALTPADVEWLEAGPVLVREALKNGQERQGMKEQKIVEGSLEVINFRQYGQMKSRGEKS